jgi:hypothetical protein
MKKPALQPYANDADSLAIAGLTIENGTDRIALYGEIDLGRDQLGLRHARQLLDLLQRVVTSLEAEPQLPERISERPSLQVDNPFATGE